MPTFRRAHTLSLTSVWLYSSMSPRGELQNKQLQRRYDELFKAAWDGDLSRFRQLVGLEEDPVTRTLRPKGERAFVAVRDNVGERLAPCSDALSTPRARRTASYLCHLRSHLSVGIVAGRRASNGHYALLLVTRHVTSRRVALYP